jgi:catechol 2,3-dioxygenase-like lactoylglutathione lyase family enzyme
MNLFYNTIVFVEDIRRSRQFYESVIGLKVENDFDSIVFFENHFVIHDRKTIQQTIFGTDISGEERAANHDILIYFETDNLQQAYETMVRNEVVIIHDIKEQAWGQKVFRFYDPDNYLVEIGETTHPDHFSKCTS